MVWLVRITNRLFVAALLRLVLILSFLAGAVFPAGTIPVRAAARQPDAGALSTGLDFSETPAPTVEPTSPPGDAPTGEPLPTETPTSTPTPTGAATPAPGEEPTLTPTGEPTPTLEPSPTEAQTPTPDPDGDPSRTPDETPTPPETAIPPTHTGTELTPTAAPTADDPQAEPAADPLTLLDPPELDLSAHPPKALPGALNRLSWDIRAHRPGLSLFLRFPAGFSLSNPPATGYDPLARTLLLPLDLPQGGLDWLVAEDALGPFEFSADLLLDGEVRFSRSLTLEEEGFSVLPATGGVAEGFAGQIRAAFPDEALAEAAEVRIRPVLPNRLPPGAPGQQSFEITAIGQAGRRRLTQFAAPLEIEIHYDPTQLTGEESSLTLYYYDETEALWLPMPGEVDLEEHVLRVASDHLTVFSFDTQDWEAARLPGVKDFQVSQFTGAGSYSMNLWTPPGPGGLQPSLSLSYNSQAADSASAETQPSWVGLGWDLSAGGYVERNMHGTSEDITDDTYTLSAAGVGSLLLPVSEPGTPAGVQAFRLADEAFWRVWGHKGSYDFILWWEAWDKTGTHYIFGEEADDSGRAKYAYTSTCTRPYWRWGLTRVINVYDQTLTYNYAAEGHVAACGSGTAGTDAALYPRTILYPNGKYQVYFETEARLDYHSGWNGVESRVLYQRSRLKSVQIRHGADGNGDGLLDELLRKYAFSYVSDASGTGHVFPGIQWHAGGWMTTLASVQEFGLNGASSLPATTFTYGDDLHLTEANNGYGGKVTYTYDPWNEVSPAKDSGLAHNFGVWPGPCSAGHLNETGGWYALSGAVSCGSDHALWITGEAQLAIGQAGLVQPGAAFQVEIQAKSGAANMQVGLANDKGWSDYSGVTSTSPLKDEFLLPANSGAVYARIRCSSCALTLAAVRPLVTRYRVTARTESDSAALTGQSATFTYDYDEPATNDTLHSTAAAATTPYYPAYGEFRGHAQVSETGPDGSTTLSYYHQDDAHKGRSAVQMVQSVTFEEDFSAGVLDGSKWSIHNGSQVAILRTRGDRALRLPGGAAYRGVVRQGNTLSDGDAVLVQFMPTGASSGNLVGIESGSGQSYRRWAVYEYNGALIAMINDGQGYLYPATFYPSFAHDVWYCVLLVIDDQDGFLMRVWPRDNPSAAQEYRRAMTGGVSWHFMALNQGGDTYIDGYSEGTLYSLSQTIYDADSDAPLATSSPPSSELKIYWPRAVREESRSYEGRASFMGTARFYLYEPVDQGGSQFGNQTGIVEAEWNGSAWKDYRFTWTRYYPNTGSDYLVGLPAFNNSYACRGAQYNGGCYWDARSNGGDILTASQTYLYDGHTNYYDQPTGGVLTAKRTLLRWAGANYTDPRYQDEKYGYDAWGNQTSLKRYSGEGAAALATAGEQTTTSAYDTVYRTYRLSETNVLGQVTSWTYDYRYGVPLSETSPNGAATTITAEYDGFGRMKKLIRPGDTSASPTIAISYNDGQPFWTAVTQKIDATISLTVRKVYDGLGRLIQTQQGGVKLVDNACSSDGDTAADTCDVLANTQYDGYGRATKQGVAQAAAVWNGAGSPLRSWSFPAGTFTSTTYDLLGRTTSVQAPDGSYPASYSYSQNTTNRQALTVVTDANGFSSTSASDAWGRTAAATPPTGPGVSYVYNTLDQLTSATHGGAATTLTYDLAGRKVQMVVASLGTWKYSYNALGSLAYQDDAKHQRTCLYYDTLNRLKKKYFSGDTVTCPVDPTAPVNYSYDAGTNGKGRRTGITDDASNTTNWSYDARGRMLQESKVITGSGTFVTSWTYNSANGVATMTYPDGEMLTYSYLPQGVLDKLATNRKPDGTSGTYYLVQNHLYEAAGRLERRDLGAESLAANPVMVSDPGYNPWTVDGGRMESLKAGVFVDQDSFLDLHYDYDLNGNIKSIRDGANSNQKQCFGYDSLNRLTSAAVGNNDATCSGSIGQGEYANETYTYDPGSGNLASKTGVGSYTYQDTLHVNAVTHLNGVQRYWYDANGNLTLRDSPGVDYYNFIYDQENRLTQAKKNGAVIATLTYDGDGTRVKSVLGSATTVFVGKHYETSGGVVSKYYYAGAERVAQRQGSNLYWLLGDHLGSTSKVASANGALHSQQLYRPYGETRYVSGSLPTRYTYTGQYSYAAGSSSDFGLLYYGARFYDPQLGRWAQPDTIVPEATQGVQAWDRYAYVNNSPIRYKDPDGHCVLGCIGDAMVIGALATSVFNIGAQVYGDIKNDRAVSINLKETIAAGIGGAVAGLAFTALAPAGTPLAITMGAGAMANVISGQTTSLVSAGLAQSENILNGELNFGQFASDASQAGFNDRTKMGFDAMSGGLVAGAGQIFRAFLPRSNYRSPIPQVGPYSFIERRFVMVNGVKHYGLNPKSNSAFRSALIGAMPKVSEALEYVITSAADWARE